MFAVSFPREHLDCGCNLNDTPLCGKSHDPAKHLKRTVHGRHLQASGVSPSSEIRCFLTGDVTQMQTRERFVRLKCSYARSVVVEPGLSRSGCLGPGLETLCDKVCEGRSSFLLADTLDAVPPSADKFLLVVSHTA